MKKRLFVLSVLFLFVFGISKIISANATNTITDVELPCNYTELYADLAITEPVFFDTLTCTVAGSEEPIEISGFTWVSTNYQATTAGTYSFTAVAPDGYVFAEGKAPVITVRVRATGSASGVKGEKGHFFSTDIVAGFNVLAVNSGVSSSPVSLRDVTGCNLIYRSNASTNVKLMGGVAHRTTGGVVGTTYSANPTMLTAKIGLNGTTIYYMYGGSYANTYIGTTDISVTNGTLTDGIYAGCLNGNFEGTTNIYLSGNCAIPKLHLGSTGTGYSYKGTVNVYIADDFTGTISNIIVPNGSADEIEANVYISSDCTFDISNVVGYEKITLYIDGVEANKYITELTYNGPTTIIIPKGTATENIAFVDSWTMKDYNGNDGILSGVEWECADYSTENIGDYTFFPVIPEGYGISSEVTLPSVTVQVRNVIEEIDLPCSYTELYSGSNLNVIPQFYGTLVGKVNGEANMIENITWTSSPQYAAVAGQTYIFTAGFPEGYVLADGVVAPAITVKVRTGNKDGVTGKNGYFYSTDGVAGLFAMVTSSDGTENTLCDMTGYNQIYSANPSQNIKLVAGVGASCSGNIENLTAKIGLDGATINSLHGGSYNNVFRGTTDIFVINGTVTDAVYAGSWNGAFEGTTNIYLSGDSTIPKLIFGSGGTGGSYNGTVNLYIEEDFTGTIGSIEIATGSNDNVVANIYLPDNETEITLPAIEGGSKANLYVGNTLMSKEATSIAYEGETIVRVHLGTELADLELLDSIQIVCGDFTYVENGITWLCNDYDENVDGDYVFTPILPECYTVSNVTLPNVIVQVVTPNAVIESVILPFNYTELYSDLNIIEPVFYESLICRSTESDEAVELSGFTWTSSDYQPNTVGTYTFTAIAPVGYAFADDLIPTITVRIRATGDANGVKGPGSGYFCSMDTASGLYAMAINSNASNPVNICDITGHNKIYANNASKNVKLVAGVASSTDEGIGTSYADNPTELTAKIGLNGTSLHSMYGGSFDNVYRGVTDIYVTDGTLTAGIFAGSLNGSFAGTTNIYLAGDCQIPSLYLGSSGTGSSYVGTINVFIADDFTGSIGEIVVPAGENDQIDANIYMSSACRFKIFDVGYEGATLYIDGYDASNYMSEISYSGEDFIVVTTGTAQTDIMFEGALELIYGGNKYTETEFDWSCDNYSADIEGVYTFIPILPSQYEPANVIELPEVNVIVAEAGSIQIDSIDVGITLDTKIPVGVATLNTPAKAVITYTYSGEVHTTEISVLYNTEGYVPVAGEYLLTIESVQAPFVLSDIVAETAEISVEVTEISSRKSGDVYFFNNASIKVLAEKRGDYTITDAAELYTYYNNVNVIYAMEISGNCPEIIIESPLVYVESDISFSNIVGIANANVANSLVTMIRTQCSDRVKVNNILLSGFDTKTVTETVSSGNADSSKLGTFYFNGIPGIILRGQDGGTYAYRSYDMHKLSETDLTGWDVSGGSYGNDTVTEVTNVRFVSGTVHRLFGAGHGITLDSTMVLDGGAIGHSSYGGAMENGTVQKAMVVYEYGDSKRRAYIGGIENSVMGDPNRIYGEDEFAVEVWWFDFATQYCHLGGLNGGNIYGNIQFRQYGGSHLELFTGGRNKGTDAFHYGDVYIAVYGGLWEKNLTQTASHHGDVYAKLYNGVGWGEYPVFVKNNSVEYTLDVEWFDYPNEFPFIEVIDKRSEIVDTSEDTGKLIIRFLETKLTDGSDKGTVKIRDGTGDCIYITFPNGQNMLIDTGTKEGGQYIVQDLRDLGVTKLDYMMITHNHSDHVGAIADICEAFEIETFLYQKYVTISQAMSNAVELEQAEVRYLGLGDTFDIGDVHFDIIGPVQEIVQTFSGENYRCIAFVMTYGESKTLLAADSLREVEEVWLADEEVNELISNCQLLKLNHHAICNANSMEFLATVNAEKYAITQMRELGTQLAQTVASLEGAFGVTWEDIYVTGRHGMIKAVVGNDGTVNMSYQYVQTTPYYADYSALDILIESVDESIVSEEGSGIWNKAVSRIKRDYSYGEQAIVDGLVAYISEIVESITPDDVND